MDGDRAAIERRAYEIWEREGRPNDRAFDHWLTAEAELAAAGPAKAAGAPRKPRAARPAGGDGAAPRRAPRARKPSAT